LVAALAGLIAGTAAAQEPRVGYVYPAGGRQGTLLHVIAGGQQLRPVSEAFVSGEGVRATVIRLVPTMRKLEREQFPEARKRLTDLRQDPRADIVRMEPDRAAPAKPPVPAAGVKPDAPKGQPAAAAPGVAATPAAKPAAKPNAPPEIAIESLGLRELECYLNIARTLDKRQQNAQLAEGVLIEIEIDPNAAPGDRELRLVGPNGLSNPVRFQVGTLPEAYEQEPIGRETAEEALPIVAPCTINGQIMPGDRDRYRVHARRGERLVIDVDARRLMPYLADAVPGWFEPVVALYDAAGREVPLADEARVGPDPALMYQIPADGEYQLEVHDSLYRGREDFVYRITVGELPYITRMFPLGSRAGVSATTMLSGWNLTSGRALLDTSPGGGEIRTMQILRGGRRSNEVAYAVDDLPEQSETSPGTDSNSPSTISLPHIINGRIGKPGEIDVFRVEGAPGQLLVAEIQARRLGSRLDSRLTITDASGTVLGSNDDMDVPPAGVGSAGGVGLLTDNADSYLRITLPASGMYCVRVADACGKGGEEFGYRLRLSAPRPDFEARVTPSGINVGAGRCVPLTVYALRKDGFDGDIEVSLTDSSGGFTLQGARIPSGRDHVRLTISAPADPTGRPVVLALEGRARIGDRPVVRRIIPAEDMTQAFAYHHLVPSRELLAMTLGGRPNPQTVALADASPVRIPAGGTAEVLMKAPARAWVRGIELALNDPPDGITLESVKDTPGGVTLMLRSDAKKTPVGLRDNLIVGAYRTPARPGAGAPAQRQARAAAGFLPAISFEVVAP
jgi:hypothetical protein